MEKRIQFKMNFRWVLISLNIFVLAAASGSSWPSGEFKPTKRHQRSIYSLKCIGLHCNLIDRTARKTGSSTPRTTEEGAKKTGQRKDKGAKETSLTISFAGSFLKLLTRGLLKKIVLSAVMRMEEKGKRARRAEKLFNITRAQ